MARKKSNPGRKSNLGKKSNLGFFDRALLAVAPGLLRRRLVSRMHCAYMDRALSYDGGKKTRLNADWITPTATADGHAFPDLTTLIARSRDLIRNTAAGKAIILSYSRNVVGTGIRPNPCAVDTRGNLLDKFNDDAEELFNRWADNPMFCDAERRINFWQMQTQIIEQMLEAGEIFVVPRTISHAEAKRRGSPSPLVIQRFEVESLNIGLFEHEGREVRRGIELDQVGAPTAYHFLKSPLNDAGNKFAMDSIRIPADQVLHLFMQNRPGQSHGIPIMHNVMQKIRDLEQFEAFELYGARVQAAITIVLSGSDSEVGSTQLTSPDTTGLDDNGNREDLFGPGMVYSGGPGQDVKAFAPTKPSGAFDPYVVSSKRDIASGVNIGYEQFSRDFTNGSYSSQRQAILEDERSFGPYGQIETTGFCDPTYRRFMELSILFGSIQARGFFQNPERFLKATWSPPRRPWIDPLKERKAWDLAISNGTANYADSLAKDGKTVRKHFRERAQEEVLIKKNGLSFGDTNTAAPGAADVEDDVEETPLEPIRRNGRLLPL